MSAWLPLILLFAKPPIPDPSLHKIDVHIAGPLAMVEVWRAVEANVRTVENRQVGTYFDLDLPEGAALLDVEVLDRGPATRLERRSEVEANAALGAALKLRRLSLPAPAEEGTDFRIHVTPIADGERAVLHYRYSAVAGCKDGRLVLRIPESREENPVPADVAVTIEPLPDGSPLQEASLAGKPAELRSPARKAVVKGVVPPRPAWDIAWSYAKPSESLPGVAVAAAARIPGLRTAGGKARAVPAYALAGLVCRGEPPSLQPPPDTVVLLVDRSRSVGQGGVSAERLLARQIIETLPPILPFNAILFGGTAEPVFAWPRISTREALDKFVDAADPNRLENGTDVAAALAKTHAFLPVVDADEREWIVLLTDGALPPGQTAERMQKALARDAGRAPKVLVLFIRQHGDEDVPAASVAEYARFARSFGGLLRVVPPGSPRETARGLVKAMVKGGDLIDLRIEDVKLMDSLPPGAGASLVFTTPGRLPRNPRVRVSARGLDGEVRIDILPASVRREWLDSLLDRRAGRRRAWAGATLGMAVAVLPGPVTAKQPRDEVVRGRMDPAVLRNALALAFTPRARACYVSRRVAKAGDAYLRGRLKLELNLERGELQDAVVRQSTLENPDIENCVRQAAWAVEYPRPEHRDAPTIANVNLVFSPRTPRERRPDASATEKEIELILGPLTFPQDYQDLLDKQAPQESNKP
jgi:hypothetical protein